MALINKFILDNSISIKVRAGEVISDVFFNDSYFQLRTYGDGDKEREGDQNKTFNSLRKRQKNY